MSNKLYEFDAHKGEEKSIIEILAEEDKNGISSETIEELIDVFGEDLSFVDGIKMLVSAIKNNGVCDTAGDKKQEPKEPEPLVFYDTKEMAKMLCCSVPTAREIMLRADFPLIRTGKILRVSKSALEAWTMQRRA